MNKNWCGNITYSAKQVLIPDSIEQVREIVRDPTYSSLKVIGSRHYFNRIADTQVDGNTAHISLEKFRDVTFSEIEG